MVYKCSIFGHLIKLRSIFGFFLAKAKRKNWGLNLSLLITSYKVLVWSIFDYSSLAILSTSQSHLKKIAADQNKAIRIATYWLPSYSTSTMLKLTGLDSIFVRSTCLTVNYLNKSLAINKSKPCLKNTCSPS